ncbi:hypothetical protein PVAG01_11452 [Phlyctema vagabunda]|uniref:Uncharacterized protein n=1 Tax=Phlyctema vagabunda TaxID=108571 RepID=A0ABR4P2C5_9HELO
MDPLELAVVLAEIASTKTISTEQGETTHLYDPLITSPPELHLRWASPEPQDQGQACQQLSQQASESIRQANQSASQAIQQASQQADQSIRQASQSASQAIQQATQSASRGIQEAQNTVRQATDAASRSISSASSAVASISSSASAAIASANSRAQAAESQASSAVLQAGAAVAAATGSAAAAGSSFLAAAALATKSAQASVSGIVAQASSQVQIASVQAKTSQIQAVTATQAALAIVGSIIASALITILIYFLIARHKKKKQKQKQKGQGQARSDRQVESPNPVYTADKKVPGPEHDEATLVGEQSRLSTRQSTASFSLFPPNTAGGADPKLKTTSVAWNPSRPPKAPTLNGWLKVQDVSPFGPIRLPTDGVDKPRGPLGGQLKSPSMRSMRASNSKSNLKPAKDDSDGGDADAQPQASMFRLAMEKPIVPSETATTVKMVAAQRPVQVMQRKASRGAPALAPGRMAAPAFDAPAAPVLPDPATVQAQEYRDAAVQQRQSTASAWTDDVAFSAPATAVSPPLGPTTLSSGMRLPAPRGPIRNTAEWLAEQGGGGGGGGVGSVGSGITQTSISADANPFTTAREKERGKGKGKEKEKEKPEKETLKSSFQALGRMGLPSNPGRGRAYSMRADIEGPTSIAEESQSQSRSRSRSQSRGSKRASNGVGKAL